MTPDSNGTTPATKLGYLVFEASDPGAWRAFCAEMLGLPDPIENVDGSVGHRLDDAAQRLIVAPGPSDDLAAIGLELPDEASFAALVGRVAAAGRDVVLDDEPRRLARRVERLAWFRDPAGNVIEAVVGPARADAPLGSKHFTKGFRTGALGIGHAVLAHRDLPAMERFWVDVLGFRVTERLATKIGPVPIRGVFLHCNARHHSIALFDMPIRKRLHHFMLEANELSDVGRAFERARTLRVPLSLGLGQHPAPDGTFSFYGTTPSGFDFEIGANAGQIDPRSWEPSDVTTTTAWGHAPTLRLKLRTLGAIVAARLGA